VSKNNVLDFPSRDEQRFNAAITLYRAGSARESLEQAAALVDAGFAHANTLLGTIYEFGGKGVEPDFAKALFYYEQATSTVGAVEAWLGLGRIYFLGKGVAADHAKASRYYQAVADDTSHPVAWLMLGRLSQEGTGVEQDLDRARECFEKAASGGSVLAVARLGVLEQQAGHWLKGSLLRLKAGWRALTLARADTGDPRLREW